MKRDSLIYLIIFSLFFSCKKSKIDYYSFPNSSWSPEKQVEFVITTEDSTQDRISNISIRHNTSYQYNNILFFLHHYFKEALVSTDTINLLLANKESGKWKGVGKGNIREFTTTISDPKPYQNGVHSFFLELATRDESSFEVETLNEVSDISFYLSIEDE